MTPTKSVLPPTNPRPFAVPESARPIWNALVEDCGVGVAVVDPEGVILFVGPGGCPGISGGTPLEAGQRLGSVLDEAVARERLDLVRRIAAGGAPVAIDGLVHGRLIRMTFRPLPWSEGPERAVLIVCTMGASHKPGAPGMDVIKARASDAGPLAKLTTRELEILRLIGEGLSTNEIAERLHRSVKTVEWHRVSLGNKLGVSNRVELARIAIAAGFVGMPEAPAGARPTA